MIIVTGGAGFIGSAVVWQLNRLGVDDLLVVDDLGTSDKWLNLSTLHFADYLDKDDFLRRVLARQFASPRAIVHLGACSSTTERDAGYLLENNYRYTQHLAQWSLDCGARFIYASSAATYGDGANGYDDADSTTRQLRPLNAYGYSKQLFDRWALRQGLLDRLVGLKFFNVFGPNEYHKGDMASVVFKSFHQIRAGKPVRLFRSTTPQFGDGGQMRDFVYVKDCIAVIAWLLENNVGGIFNLGTGRARSWLDLAQAVFSALKQEPRIEFIDMPATLRDKYQNFTEARMEKLRAAGYTAEFHSLEAAVHDYVVHYLTRDWPHLDSR